MQTYQTGASNLLHTMGCAPRQRPGPSAGVQSHGCTGSCRTMVPLPARHCGTYDSGSGTLSGSSKRAAPGMTGRWSPRPRQLCISCTTCQHALDCLQHMQAACMQSTGVCMQMPLLRTCLHLFLHAQQSITVHSQPTRHAAANSGDGDGVATVELVQHTVQPLGVAGIADRPAVHACMHACCARVLKDSIACSATVSMSRTIYSSATFLLQLQHNIAAHLRSRSSGSPMSCRKRRSSSGRCAITCRHMKT